MEAYSSGDTSNGRAVLSSYMRKSKTSPLGSVRQISGMAPVQRVPVFFHGQLQWEPGTSMISTQAFVSVDRHRKLDSPGIRADPSASRNLRVSRLKIHAGGVTLASMLALGSTFRCAMMACSPIGRSVRWSNNRGFNPLSPRLMDGCNTTDREHLHTYIPSSRGGTHGCDRPVACADDGSTWQQYLGKGHNTPPDLVASVVDVLCKRLVGPFRCQVIIGPRPKT